MKKTILILFSSCLLSSVISFAQVKVHEKGQETIQGSSNKPSSGVWKFKIDPYEAILTGTAKLYVEKSFGDVFALEFGAGLTYNSYMNALNFITSSGRLPENNIFLGSVKSFTPAYAETNYAVISEKQAKIGYSFSLMPKVYFNEDPMDGFFLGLLLDYKNYAYDFLYKGAKLPYTLSKFNTFLIFGTTREFGNNFFIESLMGIGPNFVNDERYIDYFDTTTLSNQAGKAKMSSVRLGIYAGLRLGIYFD